MTFIVKIVDERIENDLTEYNLRDIIKNFLEDQNVYGAEISVMRIP